MGADLTRGRVERLDHINALLLGDHGPAAQAHTSLPAQELGRVSLPAEAPRPVARVANGFRSITKGAPNRIAFRAI